MPRIHFGPILQGSASLSNPRTRYTTVEAESLQVVSRLNLLGHIQRLPDSQGQVRLPMLRDSISIKIDSRSLLGVYDGQLRPLSVIGHDQPKGL